MKAWEYLRDERQALKVLRENFASDSNPAHRATPLASAVEDRSTAKELFEAAARRWTGEPRTTRLVLPAVSGKLLFCVGPIGLSYSICAAIEDWSIRIWAHGDWVDDWVAAHGFDWKISFATRSDGTQNPSWRSWVQAPLGEDGSAMTDAGAPVRMTQADAQLTVAMFDAPSAPQRIQRMVRAIQFLPENIRFRVHLHTHNQGGREEITKTLSPDTHSRIATCGLSDNVDADILLISPFKEAGSLRFPDGFNVDVGRVKAIGFGVAEKGAQRRSTGTGITFYDSHLGARAIAKEITLLQNEMQTSNSTINRICLDMLSNLNGTNGSILQDLSPLDEKGETVLPLAVEELKQALSAGAALQSKELGNG